jgi:capsular exopolysaccharide synthesis family protein
MPKDEALVPCARAPSGSLARRPRYPAQDIEAEPFASYSYLPAYWNIVRKRRWTILSVALILTTLVALFSFKMKPVYQATARVEVEAETPQFQSLNGGYATIPTDNSFLQTQVNVLESDNLAWQTIQQLKLEENPAFLPAPSRFALGGQESPKQTETQLIKLFQSRLNVDLMRDSRVLAVSFESTDSRLAAEVANALVKNYVEYNFRTRYDTTRQASGWMEQQLDELKAKVEKSQQALVDYERQNAIVNISDKQNVVEQRLASLSQDLTAAENDLAEKQSLFELVKANPSQVAMLAQNALLEKLEAKYADVKTEYVNALAQYGPKFPNVTRLKDQVNAVQSLIDQERQRTVDRIRRDYDATVGRERILSARVAREKVALGNMNQLLIQHNILKREFDTNQELYNSLLKRLKDATISAGLRATNIHTVDQALVPAIPVRPRKLLNIAVGLMVGLILGATLALVQEGLDSSVKNVEELEMAVPVPALVAIPKADSVKGSYSRLPARQEKSTRNGHSMPELSVSRQPNSALAEAYRTLVTSVLLSTPTRPPQAVVVTSCQPCEGKTCTSLNLAMALAQRGGHVLLIDADLRKPDVSKALALSNERGLSTFLTGGHNLDCALHEMKSLFGLWVLPAGVSPPNPVELLASPAMEQMFHALRQRFDHIVVDSSPLLMFTDATVLSSIADGVILVVQSGGTPRVAVMRAHKILENAGAKILGTVLNKLDVRQDGYYGSSYHYYSDYYSKTSKSLDAHGRPVR